MRPAPREPSKQLNANSLPATNRRAVSGLMGSAHAAPAASQLINTITNRAIIPTSPDTPDGAGKRSLTMRIRRDHARPWSTNRLPDLHHDSTPNPPLDDGAPRSDHLAKPDLARHLRQLAPIKLTRQTTPRQLPIRPRTHD